MGVKFLFGIIGGILNVVSFIPYLLDIFKGKTKPHSYTWLIWSIIQTTGTIAIFLNGGAYGALGLAIGSLFCIAIFFLSFKYGTRNVTKFDSTLLIGALLAILVWIFTKNALYSIILVSVIDFSGYLPTARKGYEEPHTETISLYVMNAMTDILGLLALSTYSATTVLYLATLLFANTSLVTLLTLRRRRVSAV
jgi:predicted permease